MENEIKIVLVNFDDVSIKFINQTFKELPHVQITGHTPSLVNAYELVSKHEPDIALINLSQEEDKALRLTERISTNMPNVILYLSSPDTSPETLINSMRAGAREFIGQPFQTSILLKSIQYYNKIREKTSVVKQRKGKIISVFGVKGGVGATTISTNLAYALKKKYNQDVILVDLNFNLGNAALYMNIKPKFSILDIAMNIHEIDKDLLKKTLPKHSSGISVLPAPLRLEDAESIKGHHIDNILSILKDLFDFIVIDTNRDFSEVTIQGLDSSDVILTVANIEIPTIYNAKSFLDLFKRMGYDEDKVRLVLNRFTSQNGFTTEVLEKTVEYPVFMKIPNHSYSDVIESINQGKPMTQSMPKSKMSTSFNEILTKLNGTLDTQPRRGKENRKSLFKKLIKK